MLKAKPAKTHSPLKRLEQRRSRLIDRFLAGRCEEFLKQHSRLIDDYFLESYEESRIGPELALGNNPYAIVALGGYGREEQCICSDIDLLILFDKRVPNHAQELVAEILYPLWDLGFSMGHATRSVDDCLRMAMEDVENLTALLDSRFICGLSWLYSRFWERFREKVVFRQKQKLIDWVLETNHARHDHFGDSSYLLQPNIKEGRGGLRDYHTMLWVARIQADLRHPRDLEYFGYLSYDEFQELSESLEFIWDARNHLHHILGRKYDQLHFEHQIHMAKNMGFVAEGGQQPVELFLGQLHGHMDFLRRQYRGFVRELEAGKKRRGKKRLPRLEVWGLEIRRLTLGFVSPRHILQAPELLMRIFEESARLQIPLSAEARRLVRHFLYLVDERLQRGDFALKTFERILAAPEPEFSVLHEMVSTGLLTRFIPEFDGIVDRIQYDEYHLYPVDRHSILTVKTLKSFGWANDGTGTPLCGDLYRELKTKQVPLLWAALLHDIGKAQPGGGHSEKGAEMAAQILRDKGYPEKTVATVRFLVTEHLFLVKTATRRDVRDEETAIFCARRIQDIDRLKMLYLLSVADSMATGPKAWNEWTAALVRGLFFNILHVLEGGELASNEAVATVERKRFHLMESIPDAQEQDAAHGLFSLLSPRYLLYMEPPEILKHMRLYWRIDQRPFIWEISRIPEQNTRILTICAKDRPGLLSRIAGALTLNNIDILNVNVFTWRNNIALDVFTVRPPLDPIFEEEKWAKAEQTLTQALAGELDLEKAILEKAPKPESYKPRTLGRPHRVEVDNKSSRFFTIVEIFAYNFPGLLFRIANALFACGLDVWLARIATKGDQIVDVFYVRDFDGQKVDSPQEIARIQATVEAVLPKI